MKLNILSLIVYTIILILLFIKNKNKKINKIILIYNYHLNITCFSHLIISICLNFIIKKITFTKSLFLLELKINPSNT